VDVVGSEARQILQAEMSVPASWLKESPAGRAGSRKADPERSGMPAASVLLAAQSETPDASSPTLLVERKRGASDATGVSLPDPSGSRSVTTRLRSHREC
jgi:hypothetical protein